jgi:hypothetical protein
MQSFVLMKNSVVRLMDNSLNSAVPQRRNVHEENIGPSVLDNIQFITYRLASVFDNCLQRSPSCNFDFWQCHLVMMAWHRRRLCRVEVSYWGVSGGDDAAPMGGGCRSSHKGSARTASSLDDVTVKPKNYNEGGVKPKYRNVASAVVWKRRQLGGRLTGL